LPFLEKSFPVRNYRYVISPPDVDPQAGSRHDREEDLMETDRGETHADLSRKIKYLAIDTGVRGLSLSTVWTSGLTGCKR
jgi:hypothetical protein